MNKDIAAAVLVCLASCSIYAQRGKQWDHDSSYYKSYSNQLIGRIYFSRKYTTLGLTAPDDKVPVMKYRPNTTLNIGIGATYRFLTLNIGIGLNSFNPDLKKGKTHYLDLQTHFYSRKWNIDLLGEFYRGYFMSPQGLGSPDGKAYYLRNDLVVQFGGIAIYRALNQRHFSYRAGLLQNERQEKSAGSLLIGGETYYGAIHGDSSVAPAALDPGYAQREITKVHFFEIGPGIGYGYTLVIDGHYFLLGSATINIDLRYAQENGKEHSGGRVDITPNFIVHAGAGYNAEKWDVNLLWVGTQDHVRGNASGYKYSLTTGNYRLIYARRFGINRRVKKMLQPINEIIEKK